MLLKNSYTLFKRVAVLVKKDLAAFMWENAVM